MTTEATAPIAYYRPAHAWAGYLADPLRLVIVLLTTLILGYGARAANGSPFTIALLEPFAGVLTALEIFIALIVALEFIRRLMLNDWALERLPIAWAIGFVAITVVAIPYIRMVIVEGQIRIPYEMFHLPTMLAMYFVWAFLFRREELPAMLWMVLAAGLFKSIEAMAVYVRVGLVWGLLTGWRDGLLLAMMVNGAMLAFMIRSNGDAVYRKIRAFLFWLSPLAMVAFIGSLRRSFIFASIIVLLILMFYMSKEERRRVFRIIPLVTVMVIASMSIIGWGEFTDRIASVSDPSAEGSTAYRVFETYNISLMVLERPITGWPMATEFKNYTLVELPAISSIIPHNVYLYTIWRGGIFGLIAYICLLAATLRMHVRTMRAAHNPFQRFVAMWLASTTGLIVFAGFSTPVAADRLQLFYPFIVVMASFLPGAWKKQPTALRAQQPTALGAQQ